MIVILGLVILVAAVIAGVAGVLANGGHAHAVAHFAVFGYHVTGSTGTVFLYGIVVGALALAGLSVLAAGAGRSSRRGRAARASLAQSRRETAAVSRHRDDLISQRDTGPRLHGPRRTTELHRQHARRRRRQPPDRPRPRPARSPAGQAAPGRAPARRAARNAARPGRRCPRRSDPRQRARARGMTPERHPS